MTTEGYLKAQSTRQLLDLLKLCRRFRNGYDPFNDGRGPLFLTVVDIKKVLATREHIPNKLEGQAQRRAAIKTKNRRGRKDR